MSNNRIEYAGVAFTDDEIQGGEVYQATSLLCDSLEIGTISVDIRTGDPDTQEKLSAFKRNDKLLYYHRDKLRGTYYVESVERTSKFTFSIKANDALALLDQSNHMGGIYTGQTVGDLVADICNIPYQVQTKFAKIKLYGWLPVATRRANLAQVLFAVGASAKVDRLGVLRIESLWDGVSSNIPPNRVFWGDRVRYESKVSDVSVLEHQYIAGTEDIKLFEGTTLDGDVIQFSEPAHTLTASGFTILESGANYAKVSAETGTLTGRRYAHTTRDVRKEVTPLDVPNVVEVKDATLVSLVNSISVAERLALFYQQSQSMENTVIHEDESPGDVVTFEHPFGGDAFGCIKHTSVAMGGALVAEEETVIGYRPPAPEDIEMLDQRAFLTGSGTWTAPDDIAPDTDAIAVLIGGGTGGWSGLQGKPAQSTPITSYQRETTSSITYTRASQAALGGDGGKGGLPGVGGKILKVNVKLNPGQQISYNCGSGGAGGVFAEESVQGSDGVETVFGSFSSENGTRNKFGFIDVTTQEVFGADGANGVDGGSGTGIDSETNKYIDGTPVTYNGVVYTCGKKNESRIEDSGGVYYLDGGYKEAFSTGGAGGGAAAGSNGLDGGDAVDVSISTMSVYARGGLGGKGADAVKPEKQSTYGSGGMGGNGGGGGGLGGGAYTMCRVERENTPATLNCYAATPADGGKGSDGGDGGNGCIIVYYSIAKKVVSGPMKEKNNRKFLDRHARRFIV